MWKQRLDLDKEEPCLRNCIPIVGGLYLNELRVTHAYMG